MQHQFKYGQLTTRDEQLCDVVQDRQGWAVVLDTPIELLVTVPLNYSLNNLIVHHIAVVTEGEYFLQLFY